MSEEDEDPTGGKESYGGDGPNLRYDDFVGRIVEDPNKPPSVTLLSGYLGSSSEEGHVRLYLDEELCRYVEIPQKAIRHTQELPPEQSPLGGSLVWIDRDAEVLHGKAGSERRKATFLEGQIAQDYIVGTGGFGTGGDTTTTQIRACGVGGGIVATDMGPGCGQSHYGPCIPPTEQVYCRTLTGILCTRFGPSCRSVYVKQCPTFNLRQCQSVHIACQQSIHFPCVTQNEPHCVASGFVGCNPIDFTIYEQPGVQQRINVGGGGFDPTFGVFQTGFNCPSVFDNCATQEAFCPTRSPTCPSRFVACQSQFNDCITRSGCQSVYIRCQTINFNCPSVAIRCPTRGEPRCFASRVAVCPDTIAGCQFESAACGVDPLGGGIAQGFEAQAFARHSTQNPSCDTRTPPCDTRVPGCEDAPTLIKSCESRECGRAAINPQTQYCVSRVIRCQSAVDACPTRICPSRSTPCQSQLIRCQSQLDACPTRYNCPTLPNGCPGDTRFGACETFGPCPSAVDACPSRFGCYETAMCGESIACFPGGGGGGFDPGGF